MKKLAAVLLAVLLVICSLLCVSACGKKSVKGEAQTPANDDGQYTTAKVTLVDGKFTEVVLDTWYPDAQKFKKELGNDYGMKALSEKIGIGKEWFEQCEAFEKWCVGKTLDQVMNMKTKTGGEGSPVPDEPDLATGCTIYVGQFQEAIKLATDAAK